MTVAAVGIKLLCITECALITAINSTYTSSADALASQHNFRIQLVAAVAAIVLGVAWRVSADDWRWLVIAIVMVLAAELVNTAFEHLCDVVQPELHASVKAAKDVAAGAVLVVAIGAAVIGALVFWPYLVNQFRQ